MQPSTRRLQASLAQPTHAPECALPCPRRHVSPPFPNVYTHKTCTILSPCCVSLPYGCLLLSSLSQAIEYTRLILVNRRHARLLARPSRSKSPIRSPRQTSPSVGAIITGPTSDHHPPPSYPGGEPRGDIWFCSAFGHHTPERCAAPTMWPWGASRDSIDKA